MWTLRTIFGSALLARLILICYGRIQDYIFNVKFTDIDYKVFSDAAKHVAAGDSPYNRATYRYTPILAYILLPTVNYPDFGKLLFCAFDICAGGLIYLIVKSKKCETSALFSAGLWLFNPLTAIISCRGNAEALVALSVLLTLYFVQNSNWFGAAVCHGVFAVNLKLYPVIYIPSVFLYLIPRSDAVTLRRLLLNFRGYFYTIVCVGSFAVAALLSYAQCGDDYLQEALLFHFSRKDTRHNFSPYFYPLYLAGDSYWSKLVGLGAFLPQALLTVIFAFKYARRDLSFCWFLTTFAFVAFNKVCTSQYFVWYLCLLPLVVHDLRPRMTFRSGAIMTALWFAGQGVWLFFAYLLEFKGYNMFVGVWLASLLFLMVNCWLLSRFIDYFELPTAVSKSKAE